MILPQFLKNNRIYGALRLLKQAFGNYKRQIVILAGIGFVGGLLEGIGVNAIIPLFSLITDNKYQGTDFITRGIKGFISFLDLNYAFTTLAILIAVLFILKAAFQFLGNYLNSKVAANYEKQIRRELFRDTLQTNWGYLLNQKIGHLEKVLLEHSGYSSQALLELSAAILLISTLLMYIAVAINISIFITIMTLVLGFILFIAFRPFLRGTRAASGQMSEIGKQSANLINEHMIGIKTLKAAGVETQVSNRANDFFEILRKAKIKLSIQENFTNSLLQPISIIFLLAVFAFSYKSPAFNIASFAAILYLIQKMFVYIQNTQGKMHSIIGFVPYLKSVISYKEAAKLNKEKNEGGIKFSFFKSLEMKDVTFSYNQGQQEVLDHVNFQINKGEMVGLIGPSGAGKTTIVDLLLRLFNPTSGKIRIDGQDVNDISLSEWRKNVAYVSQDIFLLNDTIENNIRFYDESLSDADVEDAAKIANIYEFVQQQPNGFKTIAGERGVLLSGGQRQRVILARAIARKPKILILDEATSALDNESEILVQKAIENLKRKMTVLVIAHRVSTVINSDRLIVLDHGRISEQGAPEQLLKNDASYFYKVYNIRNT